MKETTMDQATGNAVATGKHVLLPLPYEYDSLEPFIDASDPMRSLSPRFPSHFQLG